MATCHLTSALWPPPSLLYHSESLQESSCHMLLPRENVMQTSAISKVQTDKKYLFIVSLPSFANFIYVLHLIVNRSITSQSLLNEVNILVIRRSTTGAKKCQRKTILFCCVNDITPTLLQGCLWYKMWQLQQHFNVSKKQNKMEKFTGNYTSLFKIKPF